MEVDDRDVWKITSADFGHDCFRKKWNIRGGTTEQDVDDEKPQVGFGSIILLFTINADKRNQWE